MPLTAPACAASEKRSAPSPAFQSWIVPAALPAATVELSGLKATAATGPGEGANVRIGFTAAPHRLTAPSAAPETIRLPSFEMATAATSAACCTASRGGGGSCHQRSVPSALVAASDWLLGLKLKPATAPPGALSSPCKAPSAGFQSRIAPVESAVASC